MNSTLCRAPMGSILERFAKHRNSGENDFAIAKRYGISSVQVARAFDDDLKFWPVVIQRVLRETWGETRLCFPVTPGNSAGSVPTIIVTRCPPRQCPVTDTWFIPTQPTQKYLPGLSPAVKRAYRRNPDAARHKFGERGDWGKVR